MRATVVGLLATLLAALWAARVPSDADTASMSDRDNASDAGDAFAAECVHAAGVALGITLRGVRLPVRFEGVLLELLDEASAASRGLQADFDVDGFVAFVLRRVRCVVLNAMAGIAEPCGHASVDDALSDLLGLPELAVAVLVASEAEPAVLADQALFAAATRIHGAVHVTAGGRFVAQGGRTARAQPLWLCVAHAMHAGLRWDSLAEAIVVAAVLRALGLATPSEVVHGALAWHVWRALRPAALGPSAWAALALSRVSAMRGAGMAAHVRDSLGTLALPAVAGRVQAFLPARYQDWVFTAQRVGFWEFWEHLFAEALLSARQIAIAGNGARTHGRRAGYRQRMYAAISAAHSGERPALAVGLCADFCAYMARVLAADYALCMSPALDALWDDMARPQYSETPTPAVVPKAGDAPRSTLASALQRLLSRNRVAADAGRDEGHGAAGERADRERVRESSSLRLPPGQTHTRPRSMSASEHAARQTRNDDTRDSAPVADAPSSPSVAEQLARLRDAAELDRLASGRLPRLGLVRLRPGGAVSADVLRAVSVHRLWQRIQLAVLFAHDLASASRARPHTAQPSDRRQAGRLLLRGYGGDSSDEDGADAEETQPLSPRGDWLAAHHRRPLRLLNACAGAADVLAVLGVRMAPPARLPVLALQTSQLDARPWGLAGRVGLAHLYDALDLPAFSRILRPAACSVATSLGQLVVFLRATSAHVALTGTPGRARAAPDAAGLRTAMACGRTASDGALLHVAAAMEPASLDACASRLARFWTAAVAARHVSAAAALPVPARSLSALADHLVATSVPGGHGAAAQAPPVLSALAAHGMAAVWRVARLLSVHAGLHGPLAAYEARRGSRCAADLYEALVAAGAAPAPSLAVCDALALAGLAEPDDARHGGSLVLQAAAVHVHLCDTIRLLSLQAGSVDHELRHGEQRAIRGSEVPPGESRGSIGPELWNVEQRANLGSGARPGESRGRVGLELPDMSALPSDALADALLDPAIPEVRESAAVRAHLRVLVRAATRLPRDQAHRCVLTALLELGAAGASALERASGLAEPSLETVLECVFGRQHDRHDAAGLAGHLRQAGYPAATVRALLAAPHGLARDAYVALMVGRMAADAARVGPLPPRRDAPRGTHGDALRDADRVWMCGVALPQHPAVPDETATDDDADAVCVLS